MADQQTQKVILHCDCNGYYASVEILLNPELRNVPMAVAGNPENRHGIILAKNNLAKATGVITAETIYDAKRKCPDLLCVKPQHQLYKEYSKKINQIYLEYTDFVEPFSIDESFLDMTGHWMNFAASPKEFADQLRQRIREEIGITISVGVSYNKIFAKLGSDLKKPDATTIILPEEIKEKVWPLDISNLMYVGKVTAQKLRKVNIQTIGDIAATDPDFLYDYLGKQGKNLSQYARGIDLSVVPKFTELSEAKSIGSGMTFEKDLTEWSEIDQGLATLAKEVSRRLSKADKAAFVLQVQMKSFDFQVSSRQTTLPDPLQTEQEILEMAKLLIRELWDEITPIRLLTITASHLTDPEKNYTQISLLDWQNPPSREKLERANEAKQKSEKLEQLITKLNQDIGNQALQLGLKQKE